MTASKFPRTGDRQADAATPHAVARSPLPKLVRKTEKFARNLPRFAKMHLRHPPGSKSRSGKPRRNRKSARNGGARGASVNCCVFSGRAKVRLHFKPAAGGEKHLGRVCLRPFLARFLYTVERASGQHLSRSPFD